MKVIKKEVMSKLDSQWLSTNEEEPKPFIRSSTKRYSIQAPELKKQRTV